MATGQPTQNGFSTVSSSFNPGTTIVTISGETRVPPPATESSPFGSIQSRKAALFGRLSGSKVSPGTFSAMSSVAPMSLSNEASRISKRSQVLASHSVSSEMKSSSSSSEMKSVGSSNRGELSLSSLSRAQNEVKNYAHSAVSQTSENRNYARNVSVSAASQNSNSSNLTRVRSGLKFEQLENKEFPEPDGVIVKSGLSSPSIVNCNSKEMKFEQQSRSSSSSSKKISSNNFLSEEQTAHNSETKRVQSDDIMYEESSSAAASKSKLEMDGISEERCSAARQDHKAKLAGNVLQEEHKSAAASKVKIQAPGFSSENTSLAAHQEKQTIADSQVINHEKQSSAASQSNLKITSNGACTTASKTRAQTKIMKNGQVTSAAFTSSSCTFEDLAHLSKDSTDIEVERVALKCSEALSSSLSRLKLENRISSQAEWQSINNIISNAFAVPGFGDELGTQLCTTLRNHGGLDLLLEKCAVDESNDADLEMACAKLIQNCLTTDNRSYVVDKGLDTVVTMAKKCTTCVLSDVEYARVGTGILESLFKDSESTCSDVIKLGGLDTVLAECRKNDVETLRHCACALANLSLYGGSENQQLMIKHQVPMWLFPLAFHNDDCVKYYACLAIAALVANKEIEAAVIKSGTLNLVEPFLLSHSPSEFAHKAVSYIQGQNKSWLQRLVPILSSKREEARNLATFQFAMEANIKKCQGLSHLFYEIGAVEPLKQVASSPNAVASKYAAEALCYIGEEVPHKLSQQVPLWSTEDVAEWVSQIGFSHLKPVVCKSRVDGDLLLQLTEDMLKDDLGIINGILRKRFMRELNNLKKMCDYTSCDPSDLNNYLHSIDPDYTIYTYNMLACRIDRDILRTLSDDQLLKEAGVFNSIHRARILDTVNKDNSPGNTENLDVFISYRRSNGSQLASLLKVHMQLRGFSVFIDVERLEAGKFDNNLLNSIKQAKHFLLVLTPNALDRCIGDYDCKDWIHRETVTALDSKCNIIPIIDNFQWPQVEELPNDMRSIASFNGVRWIHDYQEACVDKLERFMRGELNFKPDAPARVLGSFQRPESGTTIVRTFNRTHSAESGRVSGSPDRENRISPSKEC